MSKQIQITQSFDTGGRLVGIECKQLHEGDEPAKTLRYSDGYEEIVSTIPFNASKWQLFTSICESGLPDDEAVSRAYDVLGLDAQEGK